MKVVTGETMQQMDRRTMEEFGVPGLVLMEHAGRACVEAMVERYASIAHHALVLAGKGNNGGDGYVIARLLLERGWRVEVIVLAGREEITGDAATNLNRLPTNLVHYAPSEAELERYADRFDSAPLLVDALLGTGLKSDVRGGYARAINLANSTARPIFAVDIPSGIDAGNGKVLGAAIQADMTVTFAAAKLGNILFPGAAHCGVLKVADIGIPDRVVIEAKGVQFIDAEAARLLVKKRERTSHKGSFGHSLIVAGSIGKSGAAAMAANSAVRAGAGLVTVAVPAAINGIMEIKTTEAMTLPLPDTAGTLDLTAHDAIVAASAGKNSIALGPGLGCLPGTCELVCRLAAGLSLPLVIDADGLNALAGMPAVLERMTSAPVILTPHPGEMSRLTGLTVAEVERDRIGTAESFASKYGVSLLLKGARTIIAAPDGRIAINGSGNPGMASGGMGDVLTGIITSLVGQGYEPFEACTLGAYIHGFAADLVAAEKGEMGMSAVDVQERIPYAFKELMTGK